MTFLSGGRLLWSNKHPDSPPGSAFCKTKTRLLFALPGVHVTIRQGWSWTECPRRRASPSRPSGSWSTTIRPFPLSTCTAPPACARRQRAASCCPWVNSEPLSHSPHFNKANMCLSQLTVDYLSFSPQRAAETLARGGRGRRKTWRPTPPLPHLPLSWESSAAPCRRG